MNVEENVEIEETVETMPEEIEESEILEEEVEEEIIEERPKKPLQRRFVANFKKGREDEAEMVGDRMDEINDSTVGEIPFEDVVSYLFTHKLTEEDYELIRERTFQQKLEDARLKFNKENKTKYTLQDFLATTLKDVLQ